MLDHDTNAPDPPSPALPLGADVLAALATIDFANHDLRAVLGRVAEVAVSTIEPACEVSVTLLRGGHAYTAAFTGKTALDLDETQYQAGYGPCLDAAAAGQVLMIADTSCEDRWPDFAASAAKAGIGSSLSINLPMQDNLVGAINVYSTRSKAFDETAVATGRAFAAYAAVAVANAHLYDDAAAQARQMHEAMVHRAVIEQAKGIIIGERRCTPDEAFEVLRHLSNTTNRKLHDVATMLVQSAQPPA